MVRTKSGPNPRRDPTLRFPRAGQAAADSARDPPPAPHAPALEKGGWGRNSWTKSWSWGYPLGQDLVRKLRPHTPSFQCGRSRRGARLARRSGTSSAHARKSKGWVAEVIWSGFGPEECAPGGALPGPNPVQIAFATQALRFGPDLDRTPLRTPENVGHRSQGLLGPDSPEIHSGPPPLWQTRHPDFLPRADTTQIFHHFTSARN